MVSQPIITHLPTRKKTAAVNMAEDLLLLEHNSSNNIYFRHYQWQEGKAFTFGYSQSHEDIQKLTGDSTLIRRATGGGLVPHTNDWTYAIIIPSSHPVARESGTITYRMAHETLCHVLNYFDIPASLQPCTRECKEDAPPIASACFSRAETEDLVLPNGAKIAGAAQKRNKHGLLIQGSLDKSKLSISDWDLFEKRCAEKLSEHLKAQINLEAFPKFDPAIYNEYLRRFQSDEWNLRR